MKTITPQGLFMQKQWQNPSRARLEGIRRMAKTKKNLYREGKMVPWNKGIECSQIGRAGKLNGMYGKTPWNKGKSWGEDVRLKMSKKARLRVGALNSNWKGGIGNLPYGAEFTRTFRQIIRNKFGKCMYCDITNEEHVVRFGVQLAIHHIDYDKHNNSLNNLVPLCFRCNSHVNADREEWTDYFNNKMLFVKVVSAS